MNKEWTKHDYLSWAQRVAHSSGPAQRKYDEHVIAQVKKFDPEAAQKLEANITGCEDLIAHVRSRLEPRG